MSCFDRLYIAAHDSYTYISISFTMNIVMDRVYRFEVGSYLIISLGWAPKECQNMVFDYTSLTLKYGLISVKNVSNIVVPINMI